MISLVAISLVGTNLVARAQDQATAKDVIFARKTLMNSICNQMAEIEKMIAQGSINLDDAHPRADTISVMLMAFPHLFPPGSNQWKPNIDPDPATGTYASPDAWTSFSEFYRLAVYSATTAHDLSRTDQIDVFKMRARELRISCDTCHALYSQMQ